MNISIWNKLEGLFFNIILNNRGLSLEILRIYDLINTQNISKKDKEIINQKIFWFWFVDEKEEIEWLLKKIKDNNLKNYLLYKLIFELIENIFDVDDKNHIDFLLSNQKEEVETDLVYFLKDIFGNIFENLENIFISKKSLIELLSNDYLDDNELSDLINEIDQLFSELTLILNNYWWRTIVEEKIKKELKIKAKLYAIK